MIHSPLAGHGPSEDALRQDDRRGEQGKQSPPDGRILRRSVLGQPLIQTADEKKEHESCSEMGRDGGGGQEAGDGEGPKDALEEHQSDSEERQNRKPRRQLPTSPDAGHQQGDQGQSHQKGIQPVEPLEKDLCVHLTPWQENPVAERPIGTGEASLHDASGTSDRDESNQSDHQMRGEHFEGRSKRHGRRGGDRVMVTRFCKSGIANING